MEYSHPTASNDSFHKGDTEIQDLTLDLRKITDGSACSLIDYHIDEVNHEFKHKGKFIGLSAKGEFQLQIAAKSSHSKE
jgi:hypothetical protein